MMMSEEQNGSGASRQAGQEAGQGPSAASGQEVPQEKPAPKDLDVGEYVESFSAMKDSFFQRHDLRKQQRELDSYVAKTAGLRKTHADRANILENYDALVAEQNEALRAAQEAIDAAKPELEKTSTELAATQGKLDALKAQHKSELADLKAQGERAIAKRDDAAAQAKEARKRADEQYRAAAQTKEGIGSGQSAQLKSALDAAKAEERSATDALKDAKARAKQAQRDKKQACDEAERPLQNQVSKLKTEQRKLQDEIAANGKRSSDAKARLAYCEQVKQAPAATDELKAQIEEREGIERQMRSRIDALAQTHAASRDSAKKARVVTVVALVIIVAIVIAVLVAVNR